MLFRSGKGEPLENIANGVIESVVARICALVGQMRADTYYLTGGLCENDYDERKSDSTQ